MELSKQMLCVGRVLFEDDDFMGLEIIKNEERKLKVETGDRFFTLIFLKRDPDGSAEVWKPWDE